jgi:hypothetical protein
VDRFDKVPKTGRLFIRIVDPDGISPNMALSIKGRTAKGAYPLGEAGFCCRGRALFSIVFVMSCYFGSKPIARGRGTKERGTFIRRLLRLHRWNQYLRKLRNLRTES